MKRVEKQSRQTCSYVEKTLLIAFVDLSKFARISCGLTNGQAFDWIAEFSERVGMAVAAAGGRVVKFIGDAALITFDEEKAKDGVQMLRDLKLSTAAWLASQDLPSELLVKAHIGTVAVGKIGVRGEKRHDIIGRAVNETALLKRGSFIMTPELRKRISS